MRKKMKLLHISQELPMPGDSRYAQTKSAGPRVLSSILDREEMLWNAPLGGQTKRGLTALLERDERHGLDPIYKLEGERGLSIPLGREGRHWFATSRI